jgi:hypothetical protein
MSTEDSKPPAPEDAPTKSPEANDPPGEPAKKRDPIKFWTRITVVVLVVLFFGHILSDKYVPYTSNARVEAYVVPLSAEVSGRLSRVYVTNNDIVEEGDPLVDIDSEKYRLAVEQAEADLRKASQASDADLAAVSSAQARVTEAEANLRNAEVKGERIIKLAEQGAASKSRADDARSRIEASKANSIACCIGGVAIIIAYNLLVAVPSYYFLVVLSLFFSFYFAGKITSGKPGGKAWMSGFTTFLVLLGSSTSGDTGGAANFYLRIAQVLFAGIFCIMAIIIIEHLMQRRATRRRWRIPWKKSPKAA